MINFDSEHNQHHFVMDRRLFLKNFPMLAALPTYVSGDLYTSWAKADSRIQQIEQLDPKDLLYWEKIRDAFTVDPMILDLNSAGLSPLTDEILLALIELKTTFYTLPSKKSSFYARQEDGLMKEFAALTKCKATELVFLRNASEALETAIFGLPLKKGDEVIVGLYDYPHIKAAWLQRAAREGIILKTVDIGACPKSPKQIVRKYLKQVSPRTKAVQITDLLNYSGCQLPTKEIIQKLPSHVRYRIVDAAQSFANTRNDWASLGATHIGTSLHKWLGAPAPGGLLYVNEDFIEETWPLFASDREHHKTIKKFRHLGTRDYTTIPATALALKFYLAIGESRKHKRLMELANYFVHHASKMNHFKLVSPTHEELKSNLVLFQIKGQSVKDIHKYLWKNHKIHVTTSDFEGIQGVRISPNVFTSIADLDKLLDALRSLG